MTLDLYGFGPALAAGTLMTIKLALSALSLGLVLGLLGALAKTSPLRPLQWLGDAYSTIVRGVPELLWVLLIYFGTVNGMHALGALFGRPDLELSPFAAGTIALGLCFGSYATEVFRGAILAVPKGQIEAAKACGMSDLLILRRVLLPQVWRFALPGLGNVWLVLLKATALMSVVNLDELARKAQIVANNTKQHFTVFLLTAVIYLVLTALSSVVLQRLERHANRGVRRA